MCSPSHDDLNHARGGPFDGKRNMRQKSPNGAEKVPGFINARSLRNTGNIKPSEHFRNG